MGDLIGSGVYAPRRRASPPASLHEAEREAQALVYIATGAEIGADSDSLPVAEVTQLLEEEEKGTSRCGECLHCLKQRDCIRVANRELCRHKAAARWAEEGPGLVGRWFRVRARSL